MDSSFLVGLSAQKVLRQRLDMTANNLANLTTAGFKTEKLVMRELTQAPALARDTPRDVAFVDAWVLQRDFSTGSLERTGNPLDIAIEGEGFFVIDTPEGPAYTRDGQFDLDAQGRLTSRSGGLVRIEPAAGTQSGQRTAGETGTVRGSGGSITLDAEGGAISVGADGTIFQGSSAVGKLLIQAFDTPGALERAGNNLWLANGQTPREAEGTKIRGGFVEGSNVNAVAEITQMIEISQTYQSVSKMLSQSDDLRQQSIERLARVS